MFVYVCAWFVMVGMCVPWHVCRGQRTTLWCWFSPFTLSGFWGSGSVHQAGMMSTFTVSTILPASRYPSALFMCMCMSSFCVCVCLLAYVGSCVCLSVCGSAHVCIFAWVWGPRLIFRIHLYCLSPYPLRQSLYIKPRAQQCDWSLARLFQGCLLYPPNVYMGLGVWTLVSLFAQQVL